MRRRDGETVREFAIRAIKAAAWHEGFAAGRRDQRHLEETHHWSYIGPGYQPLRNPYLD